ncbi:MAG: hypothetical protein GY841_22920 [FCB group bacterium]|nr:hypothetical protein [FCB group bacterium]
MKKNEIILKTVGGEKHEGFEGVECVCFSSKYYITIRFLDGKHIVMPRELFGGLESGCGVTIK